MIDELTPKDTPPFDMEKFMKEEDNKEYIFRESSPSIVSQIFTGLYCEFSKC
jgi:hypothetical protein